MVQTYRPSEHAAAAPAGYEEGHGEVLPRGSLGRCPHCAGGSRDACALLDSELGIIINVITVQFMIVIIDFSLPPANVIE